MVGTEVTGEPSLHGNAQRTEERIIIGGKTVVFDIPRMEPGRFQGFDDI